MSARKPTVGWVAFGLVVDFLLLAFGVMGLRLEQAVATMTGEAGSYGVWAFVIGWAVINGALHTALLRSTVRAARLKRGIEA